MRFAYADPPYLGQGAKHYGDLHADAADCDTPEWHQALVERLCDEFPDGWALSLHTPSLRAILNMCPEDVRVGAWVKPFAAFKKNVTRAYAWEPIILRGGRPIPTTEPTVRDWIEAPAVSEPITMMRGFPGAKPAAVSWWIFDWLNMEPEDEFVDLFPRLWRRGGSLSGVALCQDRTRSRWPFRRSRMSPHRERIEASGRDRNGLDAKHESRAEGLAQ